MTKRKSYFKRSELDRKAGHRAAWRECSKAIADQAQTHRREVTSLAVEHLRMKEALAAAVKMLRWIEGGGRGRWTPANSAELAEWERLCK